MNDIQRRQHMARILFTVFAAMLLLSSLHRHTPAVAANDTCSACVQHIPGHSHLLEGTACIDDCVVCYIQSLPFLAATVCVLGVMSVNSGRLLLYRQNDAPTPCLQCRNTRAPPYRV